MAKIELKIEELVKDTIEQLGYKLYDVEYVKEGKDYYLRIYIDSQDGIDLDDCEKVSNGINDILDKADYIKEAYFLEVSSPGIERVLRKDEHFQNEIGNKVQIKLFKKDEKGKKSYIGILKAYNKNYITLKIEQEEEEIKRSDVAQVKTIYDW